MRRTATLVLAALLACAPPAPTPENGVAATATSSRPPIRGTRLLPTSSDGVAERTRVSLTSPARPGDTATATALTVAGASCTIAVTYASGPSEAQGLERKSAEADGSVTWSWMVGINTTPGSWQVDVACVDPDGRRAIGRAPLTVQDDGPAAPTGSAEEGR